MKSQYYVVKTGKTSFEVINGNTFKVHAVWSDLNSARNAARDLNAAAKRGL